MPTHSVALSESEDAVSLWLEMSDGSLASFRVPVADVLAQANEIEPGTHAPHGLRLH